MQLRNNIKIDESIKVNSWGEESPISSPLPQHHLFPKYPTAKEDYVQAESLRNTPFFQSEASELANMEQGFRRIKNEQMEKLKNLKSEYEQIRKITTDYEGPRIVENSSLRSSRHQPQLISAQTSKAKMNQYSSSGREAQILQLQKKQLQIMIENSMKKIEELLHNEMEYKRTIHELRINHDTRAYLDSDSSSLTKTIKKKEKDFAGQVRAFELQRENLLSTLGSLNDKVKYLQSSLANSEHELRKILDQKRNYEEIIRVEKDKYLNLQIQFRREKREHEIIQKDKEAEIHHLLKLKDLREAASEKELKAMLSTLQQDLKVKEKRYAMLLQQFQNFKNEKTKEEKDQQAKIVTELLSKTATQENPNKLIHETISSILQRLVDLETKPKPQPNIQLFENIIRQNSKGGQHQELSYEIQSLRDRIREYVSNIGSLENSCGELNEQNNKLRLQNEQIKSKYKSVLAAQKSLQEQVQNLKEQLRSSKLESKQISRVSKMAKPQVQLLDQPSSYLNKIQKLQSQIEYLTRELKESRSERQKAEDQNRNHLMQISKLEFQIEKAKRQGQFQLQMAQKTHQTQINSIAADMNQFKELYNKANYEVGQLKNLLQINNESFRQQTSRLKAVIESLQKGKNTYDTDMKRAYNEQIEKIKAEHISQLQQLTSSIQNITSLNRRLQEELQKNRLLQDQNQELREFIKSARLNSQSHSAYQNNNATQNNNGSQKNGYWANKESQILNTATLLATMKFQ